MNEARIADHSQILRRDWLKLCGAAGAACCLSQTTWGEVLMKDDKLTPAKDAADHLLLGAPDLDQGIAWVEEKTGVKPIIGGSHPGRGTRNALISLGRRQYLEIIAPDPAQQVFDFQIDLRQLSSPRLLTWAAATTDINAVAQRAKAAGYEIAGIRDGSRARPDGKLLKWKTLNIKRQIGSPHVHLIPFFIEWAADSPHPSQDSPAGCELEALEMQHHAAQLVSEVLRNLGIGVKAKVNKEARLKAVLKTPKGRVELI